VRDRREPKTKSWDKWMTFGYVAKQKDDRGDRDSSPCAARHANLGAADILTCRARAEIASTLGLGEAGVVPLPPTYTDRVKAGSEKKSTAPAASSLSAGRVAGGG
jgi:hypothetical protein